MFHHGLVMDLSSIGESLFIADLLINSVTNCSLVNLPTLERIPHKKYYRTNEKRQADSYILSGLHSWLSRRSDRAARKDIVTRPTLKSNFQLSNLQ